MTYEATWQSLLNYSVPQWYQDAKFRIFIHWGVYSVPAFENEWYPRNMYQEGSTAFQHHLETYGPQSKFGYKDFIPLFKAEKFDAARRADLRPVKPPRRTLVVLQRRQAVRLGREGQR